VVFRHLLRLLLLLAEFSQFAPPDATEEEWRSEIEEIADQLAEACRRVDPASTDKTLEQARAEAELEL
jgi:hypothetical protein